MTRLNIACAVTTAPREVDYLTDTLRSLEAAGFRPWVCEDPERTGVKKTFKRALRSLLDIRADAYAVFQDDCRVAKGTAEWFQWPEPPEQVGVVSLYCAGPLHRDDPGWFKSGAKEVARGAVCYVMPRHAAERFLRDNPGCESRTVLDHTMGQWCADKGLSYWIHSPSLVQHVGEVSAILLPKLGVPHRIGLTEARCAKVFCEDVKDLCPASL